MNMSSGRKFNLPKTDISDWAGGFALVIALLAGLAIPELRTAEITHTASLQEQQK